MHDRLVFRRIDALHQCFLVVLGNGYAFVVVDNLQNFFFTLILWHNHYEYLKLPLLLFSVNLIKLTISFPIPLVLLDQYL